MDRFSVFVEGLKELKETLSSDRLSRSTKIGLAKGVNEIHKTLQDEVFKRYGFRNKLASVRLGGSHDLRYLPGALKTIQQELVYEGERVPLGGFNHSSEFNITKPSYFFKDQDNHSAGILPRTEKLEYVKVTVLRADGFKGINKRGVKAFTVNGEIVTRRKTKRGNETQLLRSPQYNRNYIHLYGPSLPEAANWVYNNNINVKKKIDEVSYMILDELTKP